MYYYFHNRPQAGVNFPFQMAHRYHALRCGLELAWLICFVESFSKACGLHPQWSNRYQLNSDGAHNKATAIPSQSRHEQGFLFDCQDAAPADPSHPTRPSSLLLSFASTSLPFTCVLASLCALLRGHDPFLKGLHVCMPLLFK